MIKRSELSRLMLVAVLCLIPAGVAEAQSLTDTWNMTVDIPTICTWQGQVMFTQTGTTLDGLGTLVLTSGTVPPCVPALPANVTGSVTGTAVSFGVNGGPQLGMISFTGTVAAGEQSMSGTWAAPQVNLAGSWSATRIPAMPTLPEWGAILLLALLLGAGLLVLRRRRDWQPL